MFDPANSFLVCCGLQDANARLVLISSALVSWKNYLHPIRLITNTFIRFRVMDCKRMAEGAIRDMGEPLSELGHPLGSSTAVPARQSWVMEWKHAHDGH